MVGSGSDRPPIRRPSYWKVLSTRSFFPLWIGQLVSLSGDSIFAVAMVWLVLVSTESPFYVGLTLAVTYIPAVILGPVAGVYIDRFNRVGILLVSNILQGITVGILSILYLTHLLSIVLLLAFLFLIYTGAQFVKPAVNAMIPSIITEKENLAAANSLFSFSSYFNTLLSYALGGVIIAIAGVALPITYDSFSFFFAAATLLFVSKHYGETREKPKQVAEGSAGDNDDEIGDVRADGSDQRSTKGREGGKGNEKDLGFRKQLIEGFRFISSNRILTEMIIFGILVNFFGTAIIALLSPYSKDWLHGNADTYGFILAAFSLGGIIASFAFGKISVRNYAGKLLLLGVILAGLCLASMGLTTYFPAAVAIMLVYGFMIILANLPIQVLIQAKVPRELLGRVSTALVAVITATQPFASVIAGTIALSVTLGSIFVIFGASVVMIGVFSYIVFKELRAATY